MDLTWRRWAQRNLGQGYLPDSIIQIVNVVNIVRQRVMLIPYLLPAIINLSKAPPKKANMNLIEVIMKINE